MKHLFCITLVIAATLSFNARLDSDHLTRQSTARVVKQTETYIRFETPDGNQWDIDYRPGFNYFRKYELTFDINDPETILDDEIVGIN